MRTLGRMMLGLVLLGLVGGWMLRPRLDRRYLPLVIAAGFVPAAIHAIGTTWWSYSVGVELLWAAAYLTLCAALIVVAWWWLRRTAPVRPFVAPLALPLHALVQASATSVLGRSAASVGAAVDVLPGIVLLGATVAIASAFVVLLPTREHFPRLGLPTPRWLVALGRALGRRR